ncbi:NAD(+)/NADH kinase [Ktedonospora formicarum]|uniref:NAD kinase n=1 Tax=Ktedonospora formicarum TaxID=2778364 RepID=A0A8J3HWB8_9CHLR|nr:NAD(+)/NADH kinase [Ktedonospora formicarum]GHO45287.1 NAD kinase [Ktedonospora formicarum]
MNTIAILYQGRKQDTASFASQLVPTLRQQGYEVRALDIRKEGNEQPDGELEGCDLALVLGGDGTIVHAARICSFLGIPIVGVNFGRVGFLTELEPDEISTHLHYYLERDASVWVDERTMLQATMEQNGHEERFLALNDIVIARGAWPRVVRVQVWVDDYYYNTTTADGMILCTATGSTAYNMAVGGPLLHPQVQSTVLSPIAPHLDSNRSLILPPEARVKLRIFTGTQDGVFSADGQLNREVTDGAVVTVEKSPRMTRFLRRRPPTYFYQIINAKLKNDSTQEIEGTGKEEAVEHHHAT